jgi:integrase
VTELEPLAGPIVPAAPGYTNADFLISLEAAARLEAAPADNTKAAHEWDWGNYTAWCTEQGRVPLPATAQTFLDYVTHLMGRPYAPATIDRAMGSIRAIHAQRGYLDQPPTGPARAALRGFRREWAQAGGRAKQATPLVIETLRVMVDACDPLTPIGVRDRCVLLLGFALMARRSELAGLDLADITDAAEGMNVLIRVSKTDQAGRGRPVPVLFGQHPDTCPVRATRAWMDLLAERGSREGALLRTVDRHGHIGTEPGAAARPRDRLTGKAVERIVRRVALQAGIEDPGGAHGLRAGGATSAYAAGAPVAAIADHGGWSPRSPVVLGYVRAVDKWKNHPMRAVGL